MPPPRDQKQSDLRICKMSRIPIDDEKYLNELSCASAKPQSLKAKFEGIFGSKDVGNNHDIWKKKNSCMTYGEKKYFR
ncbi:hypothetical protein TNCT_41151 [Trichonephila clavata]|uniref:Uncharacterized protein n=1 Tax=Trichonephila clavata TaxID=2740835 RepID=A0A8X6FCJ9_TRICU|nr:hypothetical protein TNCT_41151 [Trichonephila clavata]